jgi:hypothetical protein
MSSIVDGLNQKRKVGRRIFKARLKTRECEKFSDFRHLDGAKRFYNLSLR